MAEIEEFLPYVLALNSLLAVLMWERGQWWHFYELW